MALMISLVVLLSNWDSDLVAKVVRDLELEARGRRLETLGNYVVI
jgi:hypothetical protein